MKGLEEPVHPIQKKVRGKRLVTTSRSTLKNIPPEFIAGAKLITTKQPVPTETPIDEPFKGTQVGSTVEMDNTTESQKVDEFLGTKFPITLTEQVVTENGQIGTITRTLNSAPQDLNPHDPKQIQGKIDNLGGGISIKNETLVQEVFTNKLFAKERPEIVPQAFRAQVPLETTRIDTEGVAAMPSLLPEDVSRSSEETKVGVSRDTVQSRPTTAFPATLTDQVMTPEHQLGTRVRTLNNAPQTVNITPTTVQDEVEALGGGLTLRTNVTVPSVFPNNKYSVERPEVIPLAFRSAVPATTTVLDEAGTAALPTLSGSDIERISEQIKVGVRRQTAKTRGALGSFPTISLRTYDNDLRATILVTLDIVAMGSTFTPPSGTIDFDESEIDNVYSLRKVFSLIGGVPPAYDTREPGSFYFPALLTDIVVAKVSLADTAAGDPRSEVNWQPVWRPGFTMDVNFIVTTTFHLTQPSPDTQYVIRTNDIVFKGISFQVNLPRVLNDTLTGKGVTFSGDALYGNLSENFSVAASVPSASSYNIGSTQVIASKVSPWRMLWVKRTTKLVLL